MSYSFTPQTFANVTATEARKAARKFHTFAKKGSLKAFENAMAHGAALKALDDARKAKTLVTPDGKCLTKAQLIEWVDTLKPAMFARYIQAANFTSTQVEAYIAHCDEEQLSPNVTGLVKFHATKSESTKEKPVVLTIPADGDEKGGTVSMYKDGTFKVSNGLCEKRARKQVKLMQRFATFGS